MKFKDIVLTIATLVGLFVISAWAFGTLGRYLNGLFYWFRWNGIYVVAAIATLFVFGSVLFGKDK